MEKVTAMKELFEGNCCIQGYHVYKEVWEAAVGESLVCEREPKNASDQYALAVKKELSQDIFLERYLRLGGTIECTVTGRRKYSADLANGKLEVPCSLLFKATLMEPVGSESPLLGLKQFLIDITEPATKSQV